MKALLSIKPEFVEKIFSGEKTYEYRKRIFSNSTVDSIVIYATMPVGMVIGELKIEEIIKEKPSKLWSKTKDNSGIDKSFFDFYFDKRDIAYAIKLKDITKYKEPKKITEFGLKVAPQSFAYIQ